ncbi:CRISPR-associated endonuclease Cas1 [Methanospirillum lacunae]|uniref:CRISPR-associated endonuclease Cas1 n=1 Tax=Methanospirillum lacunae TaxID=668570 RepID=A0A2V2N0H5_9EURY|nr:CRISPR-associated endonuclease Cas1 [Methanospirillum lacunae]PWR73229.1 CRISPR-associated endonuclease Cas1 [Methanospirillum lacunae]
MKKGTGYPIWKVVAGHGSHIKATREILSVQYHGATTDIPLTNLDHLMIMGGHQIQTSAITTLLKHHIFISFLESDGEPAGYLKPYGYTMDETMRENQARATPFSYALACAKGVVRERMLTVERWNEEGDGKILFSGELDILNQAADELDSLIKIDEISRVDRLIGDMYYEIMSRLISPDLNYKRRTSRPYRDPVNAILSFGYAMLTTDCTRALIGVHLDPDQGMLNRGKRSLATDLVNCWKTRMIDLVTLDLLNTGEIREDSYECGEKRCILSEMLIRRLIERYQHSIRQDVIDTQVKTLVEAINGNSNFQIHRF